MVGISEIVCPVCDSSALVIRFGTNRCGSQKFRCKGCKKVFTPAAKSRAVTPATKDAIVGLLAERTSQRGIARALKVSRDTIRAVRKKRQSP